MSTAIPSLHTTGHVRKPHHSSYHPTPLTPLPLCGRTNCRTFLPLQPHLNQALLASPSSNTELLMICSCCPCWLKYPLSIAPAQPFTWISPVPEIMSDWRGLFSVRAGFPIEPKEGATSTKRLTSLLQEYGGWGWCQNLNHLLCFLMLI